MLLVALVTQCVRRVECNSAIPTKEFVTTSPPLETPSVLIHCLLTLSTQISVRTLLSVLIATLLVNYHHCHLD